MSIDNEWIVLDTNIRIFGLRNQADQPACYRLLQCINKLYVKTPNQIFLELQANLYPDRIELAWEKAALNLIKKYRNLGCKLGDAVIASHLEMMSIKTLVSENRDFLEEIKGLPFRVLHAKEALRELGIVE